MIKRPLAWMALAQIAGIAGAVLGIIWLPYAFAMIVITFTIMRLRRQSEKINLSHITITFLILIFILIGARRADACMSTTYPAKSSQISGRVTRIRSKSTGKQIQISCSSSTPGGYDTSGGSDMSGGSGNRIQKLHRKSSHYGLTVYLPYGAGECSEGDIVLVTGEVTDFDSAMNPGEFDAKEYYASLNIKGRINAKSISVIKQNENQFLRLIFSIKAALQESLMKCADEDDAGVVMSMLLGDKSELDSEINVLYQRSGIAHILAISGVHISIIGMTLYRLLRKTGAGFGGASLASCMIIAGYGIMTGNAVSAIRALVMFGVNCGAQVLGRKYDMTCSAALASLLILLEMPLMITNSGYLLSFGAVAALIKVCPVIYTAVKDIAKGEYLKEQLLKSLTVSTGVSLVTLPVLLCSFGEFSLMSVVLNLVVIPLMGAVMAGGLMAGILGCLNVYAGSFVMGLVHYTLLLFRKMCGLSVSMEWTHIIPGRPDRYKIIIYYALLVVLVCYPHLKKRICLRTDQRRKLPEIAVISLVMSVMLLIIFANPVRYLTVQMMYVGQGDGIYIRVPDGTNILMDAGSTDKKKLGEYTLVPALKAGGISVIDYAVISHLDEDHYNGILYLLQNQKLTGIRVRNLVISPSQADYDGTAPAAGAYDIVTKAAGDNGTNIINAFCGMKLGAADSKFRMECIAPCDSEVYSDKNESSLIMRLQYGDFTMLFTGDVQGSGEKNLTKKLSYMQVDKSGRCDVLKVAHHGSSGSTSEDFLAQAQPGTALISCGIDNRYKHPHAETIERLENAGAHIVRTDESGAITLETDGKRYRVAGFR